MTTISVQELASCVSDGDQLALAPDYSGCAMSVVAELIRQGRKNLKLLGVPQLGLQGDLLVGAGCVSEIDAAAVTMGEFGQAPHFIKAVLDQQIKMKDSTCPVIHAGLQAAEKGIPFMPLRGILGSDLAKHRDDWKTISNPFADAATDDPILLVPAIRPDIGLFHAPKADRDGNVWIGIRRELMLIAHAAKSTLVSVEEVVDDNLLDNPQTAAGTIPAIYLSEIAHCPGGAKPVGLFECYDADLSRLAHYTKTANDADAFKQFLSTLAPDSPPCPSNEQ